MSNPVDLCTVADVRALLDMAVSGIKTTTVTAGGSGYTAIVITAVPVDGNGANAVLTGILSGGVLIGITITVPGAGYTQAPLFVITGNGTGATGTAGLNDDVLLANLVTRASTLFNNELNRSLGLFHQAINERRDGNGNDVLVPYNWPITAIASLSLGPVVAPISPDGLSRGFVFAERAIYLVGGLWFPLGRQNIKFNYTFGFSAVPFDIVQAVAELVATKYRRRVHYDQDSQNLGPQVISFSKSDIPREVRLVIDNYSIKAQIE